MVNAQNNYDSVTWQTLVPFVLHVCIIEEYAVMVNYITISILRGGGIIVWTNGKQWPVRSSTIAATVNLFTLILLEWSGDLFVGQVCGV